MGLSPCDWGVLWGEGRSNRVLQLHTRINSVRRDDGQRCGGGPRGPGEWSGQRKVSHPSPKITEGERGGSRRLLIDWWIDMSVQVAFNPTSALGHNCKKTPWQPSQKVVSELCEVVTTLTLLWTAAVFLSPRIPAHLCSSPCVSRRRRPPPPPPPSVRPICQDTIGYLSSYVVFGMGALHPCLFSLLVDRNLPRRHSSVTDLSPLRDLGWP